MEEFWRFLMNRVDLLKNRRAALLESGLEIRAVIDKIIDEKSFVELSAYSFSESEFYGEKAEGEGVVTGFATVKDFPVYVVAQNPSVFSGGVSKANCDKICKALIAAQNNNTPVIYILDTKGVRTGEGVSVLEGIADVLYEMNELRGEVPQFAIVNGDCFGAFSLIAAACDFTFYTDKSCLSYASPAVIAATAKAGTDKNGVGGKASVAKTGIADFTVNDVSEIRDKIAAILSIVPVTGSPFEDNGDDYNRSTPSLDEKVCPDCLIQAVFDEGSAIEIGKGFADDVRCVIGRIGGMSAGALLFDGGEDGVSLTGEITEKINNFVCMLADFSMPLVNFVNTKGISKDFNVSSSTVLKSVANLVYNLSGLTKIGVVYGKAVGLGYSLFAAKSMGYDYSYAFCNASISLFDSLEGAYVELGGVTSENEAKLAEKYKEENQDPINAAKDGYIDNIIEPRFVRQYVIASLQMTER